MAHIRTDLVSRITYFENIVNVKTLRFPFPSRARFKNVSTQRFVSVVPQRNEHTRGRHADFTTRESFKHDTINKFKRPTRGYTCVRIKTHKTAMTLSSRTEQSRTSVILISSNRIRSKRASSVAQPGISLVGRRRGVRIIYIPENVNTNNKCISYLCYRVNNKIWKFEIKL